MDFFINIVDGIKNIELKQIITILISIGIIIFFSIFSSTFSYMILKLFNIKEKDKNEIKNKSFYKPLKKFFNLFGIYFAIIILNVNANLMIFVNKVFRIVAILLLTNGLAGLISVDSKLVKKVQSVLNLKLEDKGLNFFCKIIRGIIYILVILIIADQLGYNLTGVVAGVGLGGVILSLAAQDTAKNLLGGIMLIMDKPFIVGDWIETTNFEGIVEDITFRSTRIRTFDNSLANIPNGVLANEPIINWSKMEKRKYKANIKLDLDTPMETVKRVTSKIYFMLINHQNVINNDTYVKFSEIKEDGINIMISVFTNSIDYDTFLNAKEKINQNILEILETENVKLAYPTSSIYIKNEEFKIKQSKENK